MSADRELVERYKGGFVQRFDRNTRCVAELYEAHIHKKVQTEDDRVVSLVFTDRTREPSLPVHPLGYQWPFNFEKYVESDKQSKKRMILDALHDALVWMGRHLEWPTGPFEDAYQQALRQDITLARFAKKSWASPDGKFRARVFVTFDLEEVIFDAVLFRNYTRKELGRKRLGTALPGITVGPDYVAEGKWLSRTTFQLKSAPHVWLKKTWVVDFTDEIKQYETGTHNA